MKGSGGTEGFDCITIICNTTALLQGSVCAREIGINDKLNLLIP
jgi:hypothetical protein